MKWYRVRVSANGVENSNDDEYMQFNSQEEADEQAHNIMLDCCIGYAEELSDEEVEDLVEMGEIEEE